MFVLRKTFALRLVMLRKFFKIVLINVFGPKFRLFQKLFGLDIHKGLYILDISSFDFSVLLATKRKI
jgi:hypothetical protein